MTKTNESSGRYGSPQGGEARIDTHGIEPIPLDERDSTSMSQFWIWCGANLAPINWVLGSLGIILGLTLVQTMVVIGLGNLVGCALFALFGLMGKRTGVNQMVLSRSAFGRRGAYLPTAAQVLLTMGWLGVNTWVVLDLVLGILKQLGYTGGTGAKYAIGGGIMLAQVLIAIYGYYLIRTFEKYTVPVAGAIMIAMSVLAWTHTNMVWNRPVVPDGGGVAAATQLLTAIGVGWGISWLTWSSDYSRFFKKEVSDRNAFLSLALALFIPTVWLAFLGASISSTGVGADPAVLVTSVFGAISIPVLFLIMHGPVATNILNLYSASLGALTLDIKAKRWHMSLIVGAVGMAALAYFIQAPAFASAFDGWMASVVVWISAWAGVVLVDFYINRGGRPNVPELYESPKRSMYGDVRWSGIIALILGVVAGWACEFGAVAPMQGPVSRYLGGIDFSWAAAMVVSGVIFYVAERSTRQRVSVPSQAKVSES